jgi:hypothetical protein
MTIDFRLRPRIKKPSRDGMISSLTLYNYLEAAAKRVYAATSELDRQLYFLGLLSVGLSPSIG